MNAAGARQRLMQTIHDPSEPRLLGQWLARQAAVPLEARVPTAAERTQELARARAALAAAGGRFGRALARWLERRNVTAPPS